MKGSPQPVISWYKDEQLIPARSRFQQTTLADGTCRLVIHGPEPNDSGQYKCVAENEVLSETISGYVLFEGGCVDKDRISFKQQVFICSIY